jgi:acetyltransferase-like isoleucine patch superfamily enzyme
MKSFCALLFVLSSGISAFGQQSPFPVRFVEAGQTVTIPKGVYLQTQEVVVRKGGTLILEAGVNIQVKNLGLPMQVYGSLDVRGTEAEPVVVVPDAAGVCGTLAAYPSADGTRPQVTIDYLEWATTQNSNCLFFSRCDFAVANSVFLSNGASSTNRVCIQATNDSVGSVSDCLLECVKATGITTNGIVVNGSGAAVDLWNITTVNCDNPLKINKPVAKVTGIVR